MNTAQLLYFVPETDGHPVTRPPHPELGATLTRIKDERRISQQRLAKLAGVSRRHVALALAGGNITVTILKKLCAALQVSDIDLGPFLTAHGSVEGLNPSVLLTAAQHIEQSVTVLAATSVALRTHAAPARTPNLDPHAAALVDRFVARVQSIKDPQELAALDRVMDETSRSEDPALQRPRRGDTRSSRHRAKTA